MDDFLRQFNFEFGKALQVQKIAKCQTREEFFHYVNDIDVSDIRVRQFLQNHWNCVCDTGQDASPNDVSLASCTIV